MLRAHPVKDGPLGRWEDVGEKKENGRFWVTGAGPWKYTFPTFAAGEQLAQKIRSHKMETNHPLEFPPIIKFEELIK